MKIAVPASGKTLESQVDTRFGRASGFVVFNTEDGTFLYADNSQNLNAAQGAGTQASQNVAGTGAGVVIAPSYGPNAFRVLNAAGIKTFLSAPGTVKENIDNYIAGKLSETDAANVEGHW